MKLLFLIGMVIVLMVRIGWNDLQQKEYRNGQHVVVKATLLTEPQKSSFSQFFSLNGISITTTRMQRLHYGDHVLVSGSIEVKKKQAPYGIRQIYSMKNPEITKLEGSPPIQIIAFIRGRVTELFQRTLDPVPASLMLGIVFGIRDTISPEWFDRFRVTGVLHVVSASGANVSILSAVLITILVYFLSRKVAIITTICLICLYAVLSGLSPSIVRASIMIIAALSAQLLGRQSWTTFNVFLSAFIMIMINPDIPADIGFQLSFASTLGIIIIKPILDERLRDKKTQTLFSDITTSFAAQLATLPILFYVFGSYSFISLIVNTLILWTVAPLMIIGGLAAVVGFVVPILGSIILSVAYPLVWYFLIVVEQFSHWPVTFALDRVHWTLLISYYCLLLGVILKMRAPSHEN